MNRLIVCREHKPEPMHPYDVAAGWKRRVVYLAVAAAPPPGHGFYVNGGYEPVPATLCDNCGKALNSDVAIAVTMWRSAVEPEPDDWEKDYGQPLPPEAVKAYETLTEQRTNEHHRTNPADR